MAKKKIGKLESNARKADAQRKAANKKIVAQNKKGNARVIARRKRLGQIRHSQRQA